jgi:hypothetical protein
LSDLGDLTTLDGERLRQAISHGARTKMPRWQQFESICYLGSSLSEEVTFRAHFVIVLTFS